MKVSIRSQYIAPKGKLLIQVDLSQAESWVVAYLANEPNMKYSLNHSDIHRDTAGNVLFFGDVGCGHDWFPVKGPATCKRCGNEVTKVMRYSGKKTNHATAYRMKPNQLMRSFNKESDKPPYLTISLREAKEYYERWHSYYNLKQWWSELERALESNNRVLITPYGRSRTFFQAWGDELFKEATAFIPQSTVADHFNGRVQKELGIEGGLELIYDKLVVPSNGEIKCVNQSHDSCILEVPKPSALDIAKEAMSYLLRPMVVKGEQFTIPTDGEIGERWGEMEEIAA